MRLARRQSRGDLGDPRTQVPVRPVRSRTFPEGLLPQGTGRGGSARDLSAAGPRPGGGGRWGVPAALPAVTASLLPAGSAPPGPVPEGLIRVYSMRFCPFAERTRLVLKAKGIK